MIGLCHRVARRLGASDLELHFALSRFVASPGEEQPHHDLTTAALHHPALERKAFRIEHERARTRDWLTIARADPYTTWPQFEALGPSGPHSSRDLDQLRRANLIEDDPATPELVSVVRRARVTRRGRSVAVGVEDDGAGGRPHFVAALSVLNCTAAFGWSQDATPSAVAGTVAVLATRHRFSGYWHWLHEGLLQLIDLERRQILSTIDRVIVCLDGEAPDYVAASIRAAGLDLSRIELTSLPFDLRAERLVLVNRTHGFGGMVDDDVDRSAARAALHSFPRHRTLALEHLRERMGVPGETGTRRLYISRRDATRRRVSNEADLIEHLAPLGFEAVTLSGRSFEDQVELFRSAGVVVGPHGAGLTNLMFSAEGTVLVELQLETAQRPHFGRLATEVEARYASVTCPPDRRFRRDMVVDVDRVVAALESLGGR